MAYIPPTKDYESAIVSVAIFKLPVGVNLV
jgi:hypothetical protein